MEDTKPGKGNSKSKKRDPEKEKSPDGEKGPKDDTIIVNGRSKSIPKKTKELTFSEVVDLAYENPPTGPNTIFTITYRRGKGDKPKGSLVKGEEVKIKDGMIFDVRSTNKS